MMRPRSRGNAGLISVTDLGVSLTIDDRDGRVASERAPAGRHLVKDHAEREQIRPRVDRFAFRVLGRHVGDGAENLPFTGDRGERGRQQWLACGGRYIGELRESEVENFDAPAVLAFPERDVGWLQIAMGNSLLVSSPLALASARTKSLLRSAQAAWARSTKRATRGSTAWWR
jgi:hypothetical protein